MEAVSKRNVRSTDPCERRVTLRAPHRERKVCVSFGSPRRKLQCEVWDYPHYRKWRVHTFVGETQDVGVKPDTLGGVVHKKNEVIKFDCHYASIARDRNATQRP